MKQYDPHWPFPQYDEQGNRLLPPPAPRQRKPQPDLSDAPDAPF